MRAGILAVLGLVAVICVSGCVADQTDGVQNYSQSTDQPDLNITPSDLEITAVEGMECTVGEPCNIQIAQASSGEPPYTFMADSYATGATPMGVVIGMDGSLSGTPSMEGDYGFGVCVKDMTGTSKCTQASLKVNPEAEEQANDNGGGDEGTQGDGGETEPEVSATVDSASCSLVKRSQTGDVIEYAFRLTASGTVTGPVGTRVYAGTMPDDYGESGSYIDDDTASFTTDSWTAKEAVGYSPDWRRHYRGEGDPETTTWHLDGGDYLIITNPVIGLTYNGDSVQFTLTVDDYYSDPTNNIYLPIKSGWITCPG